MDLRKLANIIDQLNPRQYFMDDENIGRLNVVGDTILGGGAGGLLTALGDRKKPNMFSKGRTTPIQGAIAGAAIANLVGPILRTVHKTNDHNFDFMGYLNDNN